MTIGTLSALVNALPAEPSEERNYIGASSIGSPCLRQQWYRYNNYPAIPMTAHQQRTMNIGKHLEGLIIDMLRNAGVDVYSSYYAVEISNFNFEDSHIPKFQGHVDAILMNNHKSSAIIEIKTAKHSSFNIFVNKGLKIWNEQYYAQVQSYMGMSGIHKAYLIALNKDTSAIHDEEVFFDESYYKMLCERAEAIISSDSEPPKVSGTPGWYLCKMCQFREICWK